jgi:DNA repair protein RadC
MPTATATVRVNVRRVAAKYLVPRYTVSLVRSSTTAYHAERITCTAEAVRIVSSIVRDEMENEPREVFGIVTLDSKMKPIGWSPITFGVLDSSLVHPREVFSPAILQAASSIILVHNHPSGDLTPSNADRAITKLMNEAGKLLGINVIDHIIVGANEKNEWQAASMRHGGYCFS